MGQMLHDSRQPLVETGLAKHGFPPYGCGASHTPHYAVRREGKHLLFKKPPLVSSLSPPFWGRFLRVVIMSILLPSCMSLSFLLPATSRSLGQRQFRQGGGRLLRHCGPGFGDEAAHGQRGLIEQRHQDQVPATAKDTHQPQARGTPRPRWL